MSFTADQRHLDGKQFWDERPVTMRTDASGALAHRIILERLEREALVPMEAKAEENEGCF